MSKYIEDPNEQLGKLINGGTALVKAVNDKLEIEYKQ